jgi:hypothetical protein
MSAPIVVPDGFTREELLACIDREIRMRELVYPERVALGKMSTKKSLDELAAMRAIRAVIAQLPSTPPAQGALFGGKATR